MEVLSPVGRFRVTLGQPHLRGGAVVIDARLGAWHSELRFERRDIPLLGAAALVAASFFVAGRASKRGAPQ